MRPLYPALSQSHENVEIVDKYNTPVGITTYKIAIRQRLLHRLVAILLQDTAGRFLLSFHKNSGWNFSFTAPVYAGQSYEICANLTLGRLGGIKKFRIFSLGVYPPCVENENKFVAIFKATLPTIIVQELAKEPEYHLLLNYDEIYGLYTHFNDMLAPYMRLVLQYGYIRP